MGLKFNTDTTIEQLFFHVEDIRERGDIFFIKYYGERDSNWITIIISFPYDLSRKQIRFDGNNLKDLLIKSILKYYEKKEL